MLQKLTLHSHQRRPLPWCLSGTHAGGARVISPVLLPLSWGLELSTALPLSSTRGRLLGHITLPSKVI